jgi:two-component system nitrate/nitrite response regulator NarL
VVDDDPAFRALATRLLVVMGLTVVGEADCVSGALSTAIRIRPSGALVDLELPDGSGVALAQALMALSWRPRVVLTSTDTDAATAADVRHSGARAFVGKADLPNAPLAQLFGEP